MADSMCHLAADRDARLTDLVSRISSDRGRDDHTDALTSGDRRPVSEILPSDVQLIRGFGNQGTARGSGRTSGVCYSQPNRDLVIVDRDETQNRRPIGRAGTHQFVDAKGDQANDYEPHEKFAS